MPTFPTTPQPVKTYSSGITYRNLVSVFENGYEQRRMTWPKGKHSFALQYDVLSQAEFQTLWDFYTVICSGIYNSFTFYDHVSQANYTCRFAEDDLSFDEFQYRIHRGNVNLIEVF